VVKEKVKDEVKVDVQVEVVGVKAAEGEAEAAEGVARQQTLDTGSPIMTGLLCWTMKGNPSALSVPTMLSES
jgi:hypothetical protein